MSGRSWARPNVQSGSFASVVGPSALVRSTTECCPASARIKLARWAKSRLFVHDASRAAFDPKSVARPVEPVILEADVPWRPSLAKPIPGVRAAIMIYSRAVTTSSSPLPRTGRGSLPGAIGALCSELLLEEVARSELLLEEVAHRSPRALVGLLVIEDRRVERAVGLGVGEAVQGVAI